MDDTSNKETYEQDEIDYFLNLGEVQARSIGDGDVHSVRKMWTSLRGLCILASSLAFRYYAFLPLKRISYLLCTKRELENDGRWPRSSEHGKPSAAVPALPVQEVVSLIYRSEGIRGFFRGARLSTAFTVVTNVESVLMMKLLFHISKVIAMPSVYDSSLPSSKSGELTQGLGSDTFAKVFWWGVIPTAVWAARWSLRSIRTMLLTTYMSSGVVVVKKDAPSDSSEISQKIQAQGKHGKKSKFYDKTKLHHRPESQDLTYTQLWKRVRIECSWWDLLGNGWEVDLADHFTSILLDKFIQASMKMVLGAAKVSSGLPPWLFLSPEVTYDMLRFLLSVAVAVVATAVRQPLLVVSRRMALLSLPTRNSEENHLHEDLRGAVENGPTKGKDHLPRRAGRRYRNTWACISYILHNDGWKSLFDGISFNLMVQITLLGLTFFRQRFMVR
ncbi:unnamed protein product [Phytomonas sp. Hart1]|nr:unnamed protein product [Phytomonas sp. Hart1]|eukprot:CCW67879.1 unnamed protein product [Phytomonas sp. isolate Hart1]